MRKNEVTMTEARAKLGELINEVRYNNETILICRGGARRKKPLAVLINIDLFEKLNEFLHKDEDIKS